MDGALKPSSPEQHVGVLSTLNSPILAYLLKALVGHKVPVSAIILDAKVFSEKNLRIFDERTRGALPPIPLKELEQAGLPFFFVKDLNAVETQGLVKNLSLDLLVNGGMVRILGPELLNATPQGVLNCHPGLLPGFRGCTCVEWALYLDEPVGNTVHFMDEHIDCAQLSQANL